MGQQRRVVLDVPVLDDPVGADVLDVDGVELDALALAPDAVEGAGEVTAEHQPGGDPVSGDQHLGQLAGQVRHGGPEGPGGQDRAGGALRAAGRQRVVPEARADRRVQVLLLPGVPERVQLLGQVDLLGRAPGAEGTVHGERLRLDQVG